MNLTAKESELLKDMKSQEELCIRKYNKYAEEAVSSKLSELFTSMAKAEGAHLCSINDMLEGKEPEPPKPLAADNSLCERYSYESPADRNLDAFLCQDMLSMEKHVSSVYNTGVFEFKSPAARKMLNHIQAEEQQHGEQLFAYMNANGTYC
jgi:spore coat protein CotF